MPEESNKHQHKNKNDPKEQRRKRQNRHAPSATDKKVEKEPEKSKGPEKPQVNEPPPEFYQNLKRETDEILKITEEANSKYKKKEIQSNWAKYEMPIESYEDIEEQESAGADFESLIQASLSIGGHFQFKHEKSWDAVSGSSPYDKFFNINMDNLNLALSTIPFFERNTIDTSLFSETDVQTMKHRAAKYKHKYYNDKKYITPEIEVHNKTLQLDSSDNNNGNDHINVTLDNTCNIDGAQKPLNKDNKYLKCKEQDVDELLTDVNPVGSCSDLICPKSALEINEDINKETIDNNNDNDGLLDKPLITVITKETKVKIEQSIPPQNELTDNKNVAGKELKNPIIESPDDLEKWLDDFLDG